MKHHTSHGEKTIFQCPIFSVVEERVSINERMHTYAFIRHPGAVVIIPVQRDGSIILISQWRQALKKRIIELPAGLIEPGEKPRQAACRELQEEIGMYPNSLSELATIHTTPGFTDETLALYIGSSLEESACACDDNEDITPFVYTYEECLAAIREGRITDGKTIAALFQYSLQKKEPSLCEKKRS